MSATFSVCDRCGDEPKLQTKDRVTTMLSLTMVTSMMDKNCLPCIFIWVFKRNSDLSSISKVQTPAVFVRSTYNFNESMIQKASYIKIKTFSESGSQHSSHCLRGKVEVSMSLTQVRELTSAWAQKVSLLVFLISDMALVFWYTEPYTKSRPFNMTVST